MLKNYLKIALRNLLRNKIYVGINVIGLALGMSCAIIIFSLVKYHLSFDNFHKDSDRIYRFTTEKHRDNVTYDSHVPPPLGKSFRDDYTFGEKVARICTFDERLITIKNQKDNKKFLEAEGIAFVENDFFDIFNYPLLEGNIKSALNESNTAILTQKMAQKYFGNENPVGKTFILDNRMTFTITGILKDLPINTDRRTEIYASYTTLKSFDEWLGSDDSWGGISSEMQCFVRLRSDVTVAQVEAVLPAYVKKYRPTNKNVHVYRLQPLREMHFDARFSGVIEKRTLWVLGIIGVFLIGTACVNFINLATAQALNRAKEVGIRKVLGSLKGQISWQFLTETGIITLIAGIFGIFLAVLILPWLNQVLDTQIIINLMSDWQLMLFIPILLILITSFSGSYPALVLSGFKPIEALKGKLSQRNVGGFNTRRSLIVMQFVIAQVLVIGMIVIVSQMRFAKKSDLGFNKDAIVMIPTGSQDEKTNLLKQQFQQIANVEKISVCSSAPASQANWSTGIRFDSRTEDEVFSINNKSGDANFIETFDLQLIAGRNIFPSDSVREFLANEMLAKKLNLKSPQELIGKKITIGNRLSGPIVGVVKDFYNRSFHEEIQPLSITTDPESRHNYAVKISTSDVKNTLATLEKIWTKAYPEQIYSYEFLDEQIAEFYKTEETLLNLVEAFSLIAIFISCLGLYGLMSFMALQKTKEIGIRKVLGSSVGQIVWIFGKEFSRLILIASLVSIPVAWLVMNQWLQDFQYRIEMKAPIFLLAIVSTFIVAFVTIGYQAIRAALANPIKSLRTE